MNCYQRVSKKPPVWHLMTCIQWASPEELLTPLQIAPSFQYSYECSHAKMAENFPFILSHTHTYPYTHILPPFHTHRHLMHDFHNVLKDIRNCFKRLITITVFLYYFTDCRDSLKAELPFCTLSSDKTQNHDLQTCTMFLSSFKNIVQS